MKILEVDYLSNEIPRTKNLAFEALLLMEDFREGFCKHLPRDPTMDYLPTACHGIRN